VTKKVGEKLQSLFKENRADFESKWNDIKIVIEYGMLSEAKFYEKAMQFALFPTTKGEFKTWDELKELIKDNQKDKDGKTIVLYTSDKEKEYSYIAAAEAKGYAIIHLDSPIVAHLIQKIEGENENFSFARVDSAPVDQLIKKDETQISKLSDKEKESLKTTIEEVVPKATFHLQLQALDSEAAPFLITQSEFMRRMKDMQATGGGGFMAMGGFPDSYDLIVNENHPISTKILEEKDGAKQKDMIQNAFDIARLSQGLLKGAELNDYIQKSFEKI
jgi:molecular chaperone HtpG